MTSSSFAGSWCVWTEEEFPWLKPNSVKDSDTDETACVIDVIAGAQLFAYFVVLQKEICNCQRRIARLLCVETTLRDHKAECADLESLRVEGLSVVRRRLGELHGECTAGGVRMLSLEVLYMSILDAAEFAARNHPLGNALWAAIHQVRFVSIRRQNLRLASMRCLRHVLLCGRMGTNTDVSVAAFKDVDAVQRCLLAWTHCFLQGMRAVMQSQSLLASHAPCFSSHSFLN